MEYRTALITGASSGIGRALAAFFARRGTRVFAAARRADRLEALRRELPEGALEPVDLDVADSPRVLERIQEIDRGCGGLDLVVANAGVGGETHGRHLSWENLERIIQVNVTGAAATLAAALPRMVERSRGHLVGISSIAAARGMPGHAGYSASKAFLSNLLEGLRIDLAGTGVRVTCVHPGFVKSEMTAQNRFWMPFLLETDDAAERIGRAILRGRDVLTFPLPLAVGMTAMRLVPARLFGFAARRFMGA